VRNGWAWRGFSSWNTDHARRHDPRRDGRPRPSSRAGPGGRSIRCRNPASCARPPETGASGPTCPVWTTTPPQSLRPVVSFRALQRVQENAMHCNHRFRSFVGFAMLVACVLGFPATAVVPSAWAQAPQTQGMPYPGQYPPGQRPQPVALQCQAALADRVSADARRRVSLNLDTQNPIPPVTGGKLFAGDCDMASARRTAGVRQRTIASLTFHKTGWNARLIPRERTVSAGPVDRWFPVRGIPAAQVARA